jgi:hypothetical protein
MAIAAARRAAVMSLRAASIVSSLSPDTAKSSQTPLTIERKSGRLADRLELHGYQSIYRFVFRRPKVPAGGVGFGHPKPVLPILIVFPRGFTDEVRQHR